VARRIVIGLTWPERLAIGPINPRSADRSALELPTGSIAGAMDAARVVYYARAGKRARRCVAPDGRVLSSDAVEDGSSGLELRPAWVAVER